MTHGLLDTSVVIALARGEALDLPELGAISAITLCGLHHGVLVASEAQRPGRLATLTMAERRFRPLAVDERVAPHYGRIVAEARRAGRRPRTADALIAATAAAHDLSLYTLDRDFERLVGLTVVLAAPAR